MKRSVVVILLVLTMTFSPWIIILPANSAGNAVLSFSPAQNTVTFPQSLTVNVTLSNVTNLNAWQIRAVFNPGVLVYSSLNVPIDDLFGPSGNWLGPPQVVSNNVSGYVIVYLALDGGVVVNGSGTLCQLIFNTTQPGISELTFGNIGVPGPNGGTTLFDASGNQISFSNLDGNVQVGESGFQSYTFPTVKKGIAYNVTLFTNSTVSNFNYNGTTDTLTFFLTGPDGTVGSCTASIPRAMMNATLAVLLNGSATYFPPSQDSLNNYPGFSYGQSTVSVSILTTILGDLNGDRKIDMKDLAIVAKAFGTVPGVPRWNPAADITGPNGVPDGKVDMYDIAFVAKHFGQTYQPS
jgi:hypothetical protein